MADQMGDSADSLLIEAPSKLKLPLKVPQKTLCGPGPTNMHTRVRDALKLPLLGHMHKEFTEIMDEIQSGIRYIFQTQNQMTFAVSGTGHAGMECCLVNLLEPQDSVCVVNSGIWGERCADMVKRLQGVPHFISSGELGRGVSSDVVEKALIQWSPKVMYVAQGESSTGVMEDIKMIAAVADKYSCLVIVDTVASLGAVPLNMDEWKVDCVFTGSQKVLGSPPGTSLVSFSDKAVAKYKHRTTPVTSYLFDIANNAKYWNIEGYRPRGYHYTGAISSFYALREAIGVICEEGLLETQKRHQDAALYLHEKLRELNLELFVCEKSFRLPTVTTIRCPSAVNPVAVTNYLMDNFKLEISGGLGPTKGLVWRIGLMGPNATRDKVDFIVGCLSEALKALKTSHL